MKDLIGSEGDLLGSYASSPKIVDEVVKNGLGGMGSLDGWAGGDRDFGYLPFLLPSLPLFIFIFIFFPQGDFEDIGMQLMPCSGVLMGCFAAQVAQSRHVL